MWVSGHRFDSRLWNLSQVSWLFDVRPQLVSRSGAFFHFFSRIVNFHPYRLTRSTRPRARSATLLMYGRLGWLLFPSTPCIRMLRDAIFIAWPLPLLLHKCFVVVAYDLRKARAIVNRIRLSDYLFHIPISKLQFLRIMHACQVATMHRLGTSI